MFIAIAIYLIVAGILWKNADETGVDAFKKEGNLNWFTRAVAFTMSFFIALMWLPIFVYAALTGGKK
jgi:hypothetical protein